MATLSEDFKAAAVEIKKLTVKPNNEELLQLYALYKQATEGDCTGERPGMFDLKGKAKWDAWNNLKGMSSEDAQQKYVKHVAVLQEKYAA